MLIFIFLILFLFTNSLFDHLNDNLIHFDDFFSIKFLKAELHSFFKQLSFDKVDKMIPLILLIWQFLNLSEKIFSLWD